MNTLFSDSSEDGDERIRLRLHRRWGDQRSLLMIGFNPSTASAVVNDPTVSLVCQIAAFNRYGALDVVNLLPWRSPYPEAAVEMAKRALCGGDAQAAVELKRNLRIIEQEVGLCDDVLLAWGALADRVADWASEVMCAVNEARRPATRLLVVGYTAKGRPKHPLARGHHKVARDTVLVPYSASAS